MGLCRIYSPQALAAGMELALAPAACRHLTLVLRLREGAPLVLFNGNGRDYPAFLIETSKGHCTVRVEQEGEPEPPIPLEISLALGISKGERMDFAMQKAVELGVARIIPILTERSTPQQNPERQQRKLAHWQNIIISACEQCGRRRLPELMAPQTIESLLRQVDDQQLSLLLHPDGAGSLADLDRPPVGAKILLLIGSEGGLSPTEIAGAQTAGFQAIRLGPRVLRTETAPLATIAAIQALWGDFRDS